MTDKKTTEDDAEDATSPKAGNAEARAPENAASEDAVPEAALTEDPDAKRAKDDEDEDEAPPPDPWDDPEGAPAKDVLPRADPTEIDVEPQDDRAEDEQDPLDDHHEDYDDHPRPSLAARALRGLVILLVGGGVALWAAPKVAPMLPASVSKHLVVAVPVEVSDFDAYRAEASARIAGLEAALDDRAQQLGAQIETAGKSGLTQAEVDAAVADATAELSAKVAGLDETLANGDLSGLAARLSTLETQMAGLTRQLDSLAGGLENVGAQTGSVGEASEAAVARLAANAAQIDGLRGQIDQIAKQTGALAQRLEQAETDAAARAANAEAEADQRAEAAAKAAADAKAAAEARARLATINAALDEIGASLDAGQPFADALTRIDDPAPDALAAVADTGVPTNADLRAAFTPAAHQAIRADAVARAGDGVADKLLAGVAAQFTGVPTVATGGGDVAAILGEASGKLGDDDVAGALGALGGLSPEAAAPMTDWIARATLRRDAKSALAAWRAALTKTDG